MTSQVYCHVLFGEESLSHTHKTVGKVIVLYILITLFLGMRQDDHAFLDCNAV